MIRLLRFVSVGLLCLLIQILFLQLLKALISPVIANAIGFVISAQLNFLLSYRFTWHDSARKSGKQLVITWLQFNLVVLLAACINSVVFAVVRYTFTDIDFIAAIAATAVSTVSTFLTNHFFVLKPEGFEHGHKPGNSNVPTRVE